MYSYYSLPVALVCGCHFWHISNDHCQCHCIQFSENELRSFCFPFFSNKISLPHFAISACPQIFWSAEEFWDASFFHCWLKLSPIILFWSTGTPTEFLQINCRCFAAVPRAGIPLFSSAFLASVHHSSHMAYANIAVRNLGQEGLSWNWSLPAACAHFLQIHLLHSRYCADFDIFSHLKKCCLVFAKKKVDSHCLHIIVTFCIGPSATASVCCWDTNFADSTSCIGIIWHFPRDTSLAQTNSSHWKQVRTVEQLEKSRSPLFYIRVQWCLKHLAIAPKTPVEHTYAKRRWSPQNGSRW